MKRWDFLLLFGLTLALLWGVAAFQSTPGYMDAEYYFVLGERLVQGKGFTQPFLWNYLDDPSSLPHPSHAYWMPLTSLVTALGLLLGNGFASGRSVFLLISAAIPPLTASLGASLGGGRKMGWLAGLLAMFPAFYLAYLPTTDCTSLYLFLGALFFLMLERKPSKGSALLLGLIAGAMHLSRTDGLFWLAFAFFGVWVQWNAHGKKQFPWPSLALALMGYLLVMGPWFWRNFGVFGTPLAPGGARGLWIWNYDELFLFPPERLTLSHWLAQGWESILEARTWAATQNLQSAMAVQGEIFLLPLILLGLWQARRHPAVQAGALAWITIFALMTLIFPYQGGRGGFFHSGAGVQPLFWAVVPLGLSAFIRWGQRKRQWNPGQAFTVFAGGLVVFSILLTLFALHGRVWGKGSTPPEWDDDAVAYQKLEQYLIGLGAEKRARVLVINPPGYYLVSGREAVAVPAGGEASVLAAANLFSARYLLLEPDHPRDLKPLYEAPGDRAGFNYLGTFDGVRIYDLNHP